MEFEGSLIPPQSTAAPGSPAGGQLWYDSSVNKLKWYNTSAWVAAEAGSPAADSVSNATVISSAAIEQRKLKNFTAEVTALPASPVDGDQCIFDPSGWTTTGTSDKSGVMWNLRYDGGSTKWHFLGGPPLLCRVDTDETRNANTYAALTTAGPGITVGIAGDYIVRVGYMGYQNAGSAQVQFIMSYDVGGTGAVDTDGARADNSVSGSAISVTSRPIKKTGLAASTNLLAKYKAFNSTGHFVYRWMEVLPVRMG